MNLLDFLNYQKNKDIFTKETILPLWFSGLYTLIVTLTVFVVLNLIRMPLNILSDTLNSVFLLMFEGLIFLTLFTFAKKCEQREFHLFRKKRCLKIDFSKIQIKEIEKNFDFQGYVSNEFGGQKCLFLNNSSEGLITKESFINPAISFSARIFLHGFAFIIGAKDLENYVMFRINNTQENGLFLSPHIRQNGIFEIQTIKEEIVNGKRIDDGGTCGFVVSCKDRVVDIEITFPDKEKKQFHYLIPNHFGLLPSAEIGKNIVNKLNLSTEGKVGFRAWGPDEKAVITKLEIKEL